MVQARQYSCCGQVKLRPGRGCINKHEVALGFCLGRAVPVLALSCGDSCLSSLSGRLTGTSEKAAADIDRSTMLDLVTVKRPAQNRTQGKVLLHMPIWRTGKRQNGNELYLVAVICLMTCNSKGRQGKVAVLSAVCLYFWLRSDWPDATHSWLLLAAKWLAGCGAFLAAVVNACQ